jgi:transaldolase
MSEGGTRDERDIYMALTMEDVSEAADILRPVYDSSGGRDGFVSIEVSPDLAYNTEATINEARFLFFEIGKRNVLVKVPATEKGLKAIEQLTFEGLNVNVTLLFSLGRYREVAEAYIRGLERRIIAGRPVDGIVSVASFFVSRVDTLVDGVLDGKLSAAGSDAEKDMINSLYGKMGVANCRLAYQMYKEIFDGERFKMLRENGALEQRLLWGSTGTKNPKYSDIKYVEELVAGNTVNTLPQDTINKFKDHGRVTASMEDNTLEARLVFKMVSSLGLMMEEIGLKLEQEGVAKFTQSFYGVLMAIARKRDLSLAKAA